MSDFFNAGWSVYVGAVTVAGLVFCLVLLMIASRRKVMANDNTTGHVWDEDLREMNNPLPRWWPICRCSAPRTSKEPAPWASTNSASP